jgi:hypothetical protein
MRIIGHPMARVGERARLMEAAFKEFLEAGFKYQPGMWWPALAPLTRREREVVVTQLVRTGHARHSR